MKTIRKFADAMEAYQFQNELKAEGVEAFVEGDNTQIALAYLGSALGGVRLLVPEDQVEQAEAILGESRELLGPWTCGTCFSDVDEGFDVCWKCGADRSERYLVPRDEEVEVSYSDPGQADATDDQADKTNPYYPVSADRMNADAQSSETAEELTTRAFVVCVVSCLFLPVLGNLYLLYLLFKRWQLGIPFSNRESSRFWIAFVVNLLGPVVVSILYFT
ncbi:MAG: DUF2007 domain-containing protein [Planctomycetota bacterium]